MSVLSKDLAHAFDKCLLNDREAKYATPKCVSLA